MAPSRTCPSETDESEADEQPHRAEHHGGTSPLEWGVAGVSALLVLGAIGFLLYEAVTAPPTPPEVVVEGVGVQPSGAGFLVTFEAHNRGSSTAAGVVVEGALMEGAEEVEVSQATIDYVPASARRRGGLYFTQDPGAYRLTLRPLGYDRP